MLSQPARTCGPSRRLLQEVTREPLGLLILPLSSSLCLSSSLPPSFSSCLFLFLYFPENQFEEGERVKNESARNPGLNPGACTLVPLLSNSLEPSWPPDKRLPFP